MAVKKKGVLNRYMVVVGFIFLLAVFIVIKASKTIFIEGDMWRGYGAGLKKENRQPVRPDRGNIYSSDDQLMASSIPQYHIYMDMKANGMKLDTLKKYVDALSAALARKPGERTAAGYKEYILRNFGKTTSLSLTRRRVSYPDFKEISNYPFLKLGWNISYKDYKQREKPFGSLASRTIGDIYGDDERGKNGLELMYDSLLVGKPGRSMRMRVKGRWEDINIVEPEAGMDVVTTIDTKLQDIAEQALVNKLTEIDARSGVVILMEVKTGKVRACVNMDRVSPGYYQEKINRAVADEGEPGSTFKVASMMVALEDGVVSPNDTIDTKNGLYPFYGSVMRDHNAHRGGYHKITAAQTIWYSSNVGISRIIDENYKNNPGKFVDGLYKIGLNIPMNIEIPGAGKPKIRYPNKDNWYKTALPWMSIGYEVNIPPIYTLAFFNAIANNGKMIRPYFTESIRKDGEIIQRFDTETVKSSICSDKTLALIREMLVNVVDSGTAKAAKSEYVNIAGKTGTAQISQGAQGYKSGVTRHQVTFCGYFPAEKPIYSCICVIREPRGTPSGGTMSGEVVKNVAERTYARTLRMETKEAAIDSTVLFYPKVKGGSHEEVNMVLRKLNLRSKVNDSIKSEWVKVKTSEEGMEFSAHKAMDKLVPNVVGMSAKDAVYLLEQSGLYVNIAGKGVVSQQSLPPGSVIRKGSTISLTLK